MHFVDVMNNIDYIRYYVCWNDNGKLVFYLPNAEWRKTAAYLKQN